MTIVGISLGTTNSMITAYKGDRLIKIPNAFGEYLQQEFEENFLLTVVEFLFYNKIKK